MTVSEIYAAALARLREAGWEHEESRGTARILADEATGTRFSHLSQPEKALESEILALWQDNLETVAGGVPLPYVLGRREFFGLEFLCDKRALIPRPETEILVEAAIEKLKGFAAPRIADLGTGSGCIAVSLAHALPLAQVWATDLSLDSLELARANAEKHNVAERMTFVPGIAGDWTTPLRGLKFDAILSNPPYIARAEIETLQTQVRDFEPHGALNGGDDGLDCYRQLAAQCGQNLAPGGVFLAELGAGQFDAVRAIFVESGWRVEEPLLDFQGIARVLQAGRSTQTATSAIHLKTRIRGT